VIVLAIDTSHPVGSVALSVDGEVSRPITFGDGSSHLSGIGGAVEAAVAGAGVAAAGLDRIALVHGPGSFTGLRIGMSYAKGLCAGLNAEMVVMSTLELLALPLMRRGSTACAMVDARKGEIYGAVYEAGGGPGANVVPARPLAGPAATEPGTFVAEVMRFDPVYLGSGALRYRPILESVHPGCRIGDESAAQPSSALLAELAPALEPLSQDELAGLEPVYLRSHDAVFKPLKVIDPDG
jgi:tRNA threonylcarbamoyladenosine biosynthesis protein TsaB